MLIYEKQGYIQVRYQADKDYIIFDWTNFLVTLAEITELHHKALDAARANGCWYYVAETSRVTNMLRPEVIRWWADDWVPRLNEAGLKAIITVVPSVALAAMSTHSWQAQVVGSITMLNARSLSDAEALLADLQHASNPTA